MKRECLFTQTTVDHRDNPVPGLDASSYFNSMDSAAGVDSLLYYYSEGQQRGLSNAERAIALGDGAPWTWSLVGEHFP